MKSHHAIELALLGLLALLWGSSYLLIKIAVTDIPPITLIATRVALAATFLLVVIAWQGERLPQDTKTWRLLFVQSMFNSIGAWTVLAWGQQFIDSGLASVLNSTSPLFVFLITYLFTSHERTDLIKLASACLGIVGAIVVVGPQVLTGLGQQVAGQMAVLVGAVLYAGAAIYGKKLHYLPTTVTAAGTMIWATICLAPASLLLDQPWHLRPSASAIVATLVLGVLSTGIALLIYFRLGCTLGSMGVASQSYLRAGVGVVLGIVVLGEQATPLTVLGLTAIVLAVVGINSPVRGR